MRQREPFFKLWHLMPFTSAAATYCYTHNVSLEHPDPWLTAAVFFTSCTALFGIRTLGQGML